jgi:hypothetical protein
VATDDTIKSGDIPVSIHDAQCGKFKNISDSRVTVNISTDEITMLHAKYNVYILITVSLLVYQLRRSYYQC